MWRILAVTAVLSASPVLARAQSPEARTQARALFVEGTSLADRGEWAQAADRFRRALELYPSGATRFNFATSLARLGKLVEAAEQARAVMAEAPPADRARAGAEALLREIEPRLGHLTVRLDGDPSGVEILIDQVPLPLDRLGSAVPVDPQRHAVVARRGQTEVSQEVNVEEGASAQVTLALPAPAVPRRELRPEVVVTPPPEEPRLVVQEASPPEERRPRPDRRIDEPAAGKPRWIYFAASAGLLGTGLAVDIAPSSSRNYELNALDFVPVGLYVAAGVAAVLGIM
ncbi:MAG: hypothetical protein HYY06_32605 [Deltaproteobacteria bacterium]|nr:hypothetical protein [Deltaproteobacteria bacterium]